MQGVIKSYDPSSREGTLLRDTDWAEIELATDDRAVVSLREGPRVIDVDAVMAHAAAHRLLNGGRPPSPGRSAARRA